MIDMFVKSTHTEYNHACECLTEFEGTEKVEPLLRLYSLETPFYSKVGGPDFCNILLEPLVRNLDALCDRHYQGTSYRGLTMTKEDLEDYEEALRQEKEENKESIITLASFASTTRDELLARGFAAAYKVEDKITVLITCIFPKRCDTAIALYKVSESISCISHFEDEEEVLVYPGTMFRVTEIDTTSDPSITQLHLTNVMPEYHPGAVLCKAAKKKAIKTFVPKILQ
ncbi:hypothetical protein I4U23_011766 [Adineta vaga]|nr:hypothetical protein I4U23_011766 [Adineta vaga]